MNSISFVCLIISSCLIAYGAHELPFKKYLIVLLGSGIFAYGAYILKG
jgi:hypothetical protein